FNDSPTYEIYTISLHDALPICFFQYGSDQGPEKAAAPQLNNDFYEQNIKPYLSSSTLAVLNKAEKNQVLWNAMLFSSPEWMNRRSEEHTSELQSRENLVCRLLL